MNASRTFWLVAWLTADNDGGGTVVAGVEHVGALQQIRVHAHVTHRPTQRFLSLRRPVVASVKQ